MGYHDQEGMNLPEGGHIVQTYKVEEEGKFIGGVVAYGVLTLALLAAVAIAADAMYAMLPIIGSAMFAYLNFNFVRAMDGGYMPFLSYRVLRWLIIVTALASLVCAVVAFFGLVRFM